MDIEISKILKVFESFGDDYKPKFAEITVNKRINDRFFLGNSNPNPGTIIHSGVVTDNFDFFIIP